MDFYPAWFYNIAVGRIIEGIRFRNEDEYDKALKEKLAAFLEGKTSYKTADVPVVDDTVILPGHTKAVRVALSPENLPILYQVPISALDFLKKSVKSRCAQRGLSVGDTTGTGYHMYTDEKDFEYSEELNAYIAKVWVENHSLRPTSLKQGTGLYRYYYLNESNRLQGQSLIRAVNTGDISIEGNSWGYVGATDDFGEFNLTGLYIDIDPTTFRAVDPFNLKPIEVPNSAPNFGRAEIDMHLRKPLPLPTRQLLIGETPHMTLARDVNIEINPATLTSNKKVEHPFAGRHINSWLLDGGVTDHPVRVEILDFTSPTVNPHRVYMNAYRDLI